MCKCQEGIKTQEYKNQIVLDYPFESNKTVCIDACLASEIKLLWSLGIETTGCCCGHNYELPYIGVLDKYIYKMKELGYITHTNINGESNFDRLDSFYPKSIDINYIMVNNSIKHMIKLYRNKSE